MEKHIFEILNYFVEAGKIRLKFLKLGGLVILYALNVRQNKYFCKYF